MRLARRQVERSYQQEEQEEDPSSFFIKLSEDTSAFHPQEPSQNDEMQIEEEVKITELTEEEINKIYARLPALDTKTDDKREFHMREASLKPPLAPVKQSTFPPSEETAPPKEQYDPNEDLTIVRYSPENDVALAPHITITFSHPMIALSTLDQIAASEVPVKISPEVEGKFRYVGTKTLLFEPTYRFPMASVFKVEIPQGTKSAVGNALKEAFSFSFSTPPPTLKRHRVIGNTRKPFLFVEFDQDISPVDLIPFIKVKANNTLHPIPLRLVDESEYIGTEYERSIKASLRSAAVGRHFIFVIDGTEQLPHDSDISILFSDQLPSAEGPIKTVKEQSFSFRTYGPLKYVRQSEPVHPGDTWSFTFSNPLDETLDIAQLISVSPPLESLVVTWADSVINVRGKSKGNTIYTVVIDKSLRDIYQQTLAADETLSVHVAEARKNLYAFQEQMVYLKPDPEVYYSVVAVNLETISVAYFQVQPEELRNANQWQEYGYDNKQTWENIKVGKKVDIVTIPVPDYQPDTPIEVKIPLHLALTHPEEHLGHVALCVFTDQPDIRTIYAYVQVTDIGLSGLHTNQELELWATRFSSNQPIQQLQITTPTGTIITDEQGLARYDGNAVGGYSDLKFLARSGNDAALLQFGFYRQQEDDQYLSFITDDRQLYKPNEEVHIQGWIRLVKTAPYLTHSIPDDFSLSYSIRDSRHVEIHTGTVGVKGGSFTLAFTLPDNVNLGSAFASFSGPNLSLHHSFNIQEFRTPEFNIVVHSDPAPKYANSNTVVSVSASYFSGGGLDDSEVKWSGSGVASSYAPPNWAEYSFATDDSHYRPYIYHHPKAVANTQLISKTDGNGKNEILVAFEGSLNPPSPVTVSLEAVVKDINRQTVSASTSFIVHPSRYYVGVKVEKKIVGEEEKAAFHFIVTDIDGKPVPDVAIALSIEQFVERIRNGRAFDEKEQKVAEVIHSKSEPVPFEVALPSSGQYSLTARIQDPFRNEIFSVASFWVAGQSSPKKRPSTSFQVIADKAEYTVGEEITLMIESPLHHTRGMIYTIARSIIHRHSFSLEEGQHSYVYKHRVEEEQLPGLGFYFEIVGEKDGPNDRLLPARSSSSLFVPISLSTRELIVDIAPVKKVLSPGEESSIEVHVHSAHSSSPVEKAEILLIVVDEAVLSLSPPSDQDFLRRFYPNLSGHLSRYDNRDNYFNPDWSGIHFLRPEIMMMKRFARGGPRFCAFGGGGLECMACNNAMNAPMEMQCDMMMMNCMVSTTEAAMDGGGGGEGAPIAVRKNFNPLALFAHHLVTDHTGTAKVTFTLPDSLTSYRVIAFTTHNAKHFGRSESSVQVRLPLMIRPSLPRFLNFGDRSDLPLVIQNQSEQPLEAALVIRTSNLHITSPRGVRLSLAPQQRIEYRFKALTDSVGAAVVQLGISSPHFADAIEKSLNVWTPATTEAFATYGEMDGEEEVMEQPLTKPLGVFPQFGGLSLSFSSTILQGLLDAFEYLIDYPFDCTEQIASKMLILISSKDILHAFHSPKLPQPDELKATVAAMIEKLMKRQNSNGGFGWWNSANDDPFLSSFVALSLSRYHFEDYPRNAQIDQLIANAKQYLRSIESHFLDIHSPSTRTYLKAFSLYVLMTFGEDVGEQAAKLYESNKGKELPVEVVGWIILSLPDNSPIIKELLKLLSNRINETAETANFISSFADDASARHVLLLSTVKANAVGLEAMMKGDGANSVIAKLAKGLMAVRKKGRWHNTQDNCFAAIAILKYFRQYELAEPNFTARSWLGDRFAGERSFRGRSTDTHLTFIPMHYLVDDHAQNNTSITVSKQGEGRMYYRIGLEYALTSFELAPLSAGFAVDRIYEAVDQPDDVALVDGVWRVKAGARIKVKLSLFNQSQRYHVALVDKLPAGFEVLNPALQTTEKLPGSDPIRPFSCFWWRNWFEHQNFRDERVEAFSTFLYPGVHEFSYFARATTQGSFIAPPPKAEEMYSPEVFGRYRNERVEVL